MKTFLNALAVVMAFGVLPAGCGGALVSTGASIGIAASEERGLDGAARDLKTEVAISETWIRHDHTLIADIGLMVYEGRVLLVGIVDREETRADAVHLAWTVPGVQEVINEIRLTSEDGRDNMAKDAIITGELKTKITFDRKIMAINYAIKTVNAQVYLMGIARNDAELERVIHHARSIDYVRKVVSYVRVRKA